MIENITPGYRNICYKNGKEGQGEIVLFGWDKEGNRDKFIIPFCPTAKYEIKGETELKSIFDTNLMSKEFKNSWDRKKWIDALSEGINVMEAFRPEQEFLINNFGSLAYNDNFNTLPLRTHFLDIEVAVEDTFCKPEEARYPINVITLYDSLKQKYYSWVLNMDVTNTTPHKNLVLNKFTNETCLLKDFVDWYTKNYPDVITGWNTYYFDIPYIIKRIENVLGQRYARMMSPVDKYRTLQKKDYFNNTYISLEGISQLDLKILYQDKFQITPALDGGYSLSNVSLHELDEDKIDYEGSMKDFYKRDFQKFYEYNVRDVELTVKLEQKLNMIPLARRITTFGLCQYEQIYGSIAYIIGSLAIYARNKHGKIFKSYSREDIENTKFEGAFVFPTEAGFYPNGCFCVDFSSLYPNESIALNLSPETKVGQLFDNNDGTYNIKTNNGSKLVTKKQLDMLLDKKCILSKNNTLFFKHEVKSGVFAEWCKYFFDNRKVYQKKKKEADSNGEKTKKQLKECKDAEQKLILKEKKHEFDRNKGIYDTVQYALKIMINSAYGTLGCNFSPIFDIDLAQSITINGQFTNKAGAEFIKKSFREKYGCSEDFNPTISGDTDSVGGESILTIKIDNKQTIC